jgi:allantoin racemase
MKIAIVNANSTAVFTGRLVAQARLIAAAGTEIVGMTPAGSPPSVESHTQEALAAVGVMDCIRDGESHGVDAYVIACFGDTGVAPAREIARGPVVGMTEAALFTACLLAARFSIVTLPPRTIVHARRVVHDYGLETRVGSIRAIAADVADAAVDEAALLGPMLEQSRRALAEDGAEAIILGCAGIAGLVDPLREALGVPVIDGVAAGVKTAEGLVTQSLRTSKLSSFAFPPGS